MWAARGHGYYLERRCMDQSNQSIRIHELRARSLIMLRDYKAQLERMAQTTVIDDLSVALMAINYALMELNLESAIASGELTEE